MQIKQSWEMTDEYPTTVCKVLNTDGIFDALN